MAEWWRRAQWALSATASTNDMMYSYGIGVLEVLAKSDLAGSEEKSLFVAVWEGSCTKMRDNEIRHLLEQFRDATRQEEGGPPIGHSSEQKSTYPGTVNAPPVLGENGTSEDEFHGHPGGDDSERRDRMLRTVRREILAAHLKVTLDEQLKRGTSPTVKAMAQMKLPPMTGSNASDPRQAINTKTQDTSRVRLASGTLQAAGCFSIGGNLISTRWRRAGDYSNRSAGTSEAVSGT